MKNSSVITEIFELGFEEMIERVIMKIGRVRVRKREVGEKVNEKEPNCSKS